jgi:hypothetical protein
VLITESGIRAAGVSGLSGDGQTGAQQTDSGAGLDKIAA